MSLVRALVCLSLGGCAATQPYDTSADAARDEAVDDVGPEARVVVLRSLYAAFPGASLVDEREVFDPAGEFVGTLLTVQVAPMQDEAECDAFFCGAELYSVLASDRADLPTWAFATAGGPLGAPDDADLAFDPNQRGWYWFAGDLLVDIDGSTVDPAELDLYQPPVEHLDAWDQQRAAAWDELRQPASGCTGSYGSSLGSYWGVTAYSNGSCTGTGSGTYQCVEFIDRFHTVTTSHVGNANTYDDGDNPRKMNMIFFANNNGTYGPKTGDIVISNGGTYGHVAISTAVPSTSMTVLHQNWSSTTGSLTMSRSSTNVSGFSSSYSVAGWSRPGWEFGGSLDSTSSIYGWTVRNATITAEDSTGFTLNPSSDPGLVSPSGLNINGSSGKYRYVKVRMKSLAPDGTVRVYFTTAASTSWDEAKAVSGTVSTSGSWATVAIDMSSNSYWTASRINQLRVDPANNGNSGSSDLITIDKIWLEP